MPSHRDNTLLATTSQNGTQSAAGKRIELQNYEDCLGVAAPGTNPASFVAANVGLATVAAGNRLLFIDGTAGIYVATSATAAVLSNTGADAVRQGTKVKITGLSSGPVEYWQTAATGSGTAVFAPAGSSVSLGTASGTKAAASGQTTVLTIPIPAATELEIIVSFSAGNLESSTVVHDSLSGDYIVKARRIGTAAPVISVNVPASNFTSTSGANAWTPTVAVSSNNLIVELTGDAANDYYYSVSAEQAASKPVASYPISADPLVALVAAVVAEPLGLLLLPDRGMTPSSPTEGVLITDWADQSGAGLNLHTTKITPNIPSYHLDGSGKKCIKFVSAGGETKQEYTILAGLGGAGTDHTFSWRTAATNAGVSSSEFLFSSADGSAFTISMNADPAGWAAAGTHLTVWSAGTYVDFGVTPSGKHDYELQLNHTTGHAQLWIDGVLVSGTRNYTAITLPTGMVLGGYAAGGYGYNGLIYGIRYFAGLGTSQGRAAWIALMNNLSGAT